MKRRALDVKHIDLDSQDEHVKQFVLSLDLDPEGSVLEADGRAVAHVLPVADAAVRYDRDKLAAAILSRRDDSRVLNQDWEHADRDVWNRE